MFFFCGPKISKKRIKENPETTEFTMYFYFFIQINISMAECDFES